MNFGNTLSVWTRKLKNRGWRVLSDDLMVKDFLPWCGYYIGRHDDGTFSWGFVWADGECALVEKSKSFEDIARHAMGLQDAVQIAPPLLVGVFDQSKE